MTMLSKTLCRTAAASAILLATVAPALAHHSFAMFDKDATRVLKGTVKDFQRVNPHGYLDVAVVTKSGRTQVWSIELQSALAMGRQKIMSDTFKMGDPVTVTIHPLRDGTTGGAFMTALLANGMTVGAVTE